MNTNKNIFSDISSDIGFLQLSDSFFPTGMYTTSNGLETLFYKKKVTGKKTLYEFLKTSLTSQIGPADLVALSNAYINAEKKDINNIIEIDTYLFSLKIIKEIRDASVRSGKQMLRCLNEFILDNKILNDYYNAITNKNTPGCFPISLAVGCNALGIKREKACIILLYGFSVSVIGAALRLGMIQHIEGQQIIHQIKPIFLDILENNIDRSTTNMWQFSPGIDLIQIEHEKMDSKMFIT
ncbi:MAG: urease accessory protein UreF [Nitrososphaeraceae archaeon]